MYRIMCTNYAFYKKKIKRDLKQLCTHEDNMHMFRQVPCEDEYTFD